MGRPVTHQLPEKFLRYRVKVLVIGCGGNCAVMASGLAQLHRALVACGHPGGLKVFLRDGDVVTDATVARGPFTPADIGLNKAVVLAHRANVFWGQDFEAVPLPVGPSDHSLSTSNGYPFDGHPHLVIGCVDSRKSRATIAKLLTARYRAESCYWLDLGNNASSGQFVLGQPKIPGRQHKRERLPTIAELYPEVVDESLPEDDAPSCGAVEALERQEPFTNHVVVYHALAMLAQLFRHGGVEYHGGFVNLLAGTVHRLPVDPDLWEKTRRLNRREAKRVQDAA